MDQSESTIQLRRQVTGVLIPDGDDVVLEEDTPVVITQRLGGHFTVAVPSGQKFRIAGADADALGLQPPQQEPGLEGLDPEVPLSPDAAEELAWKLLRKVHDPEIPLNIVDLGLVYTLKMHQRGDGLLLAEVRMTLTAPGCGMGDVLLRDVERELRRIPGVDTIDAKIVFDPVWNPNTMLSDAAKLQLGLL